MRLFGAAAIFTGPPTVPFRPTNKTARAPSTPSSNLDSICCLLHTASLLAYRARRFVVGCTSCTCWLYQECCHHFETCTGCHVDAVKLSSLRDRPQMPHVDVVKFPTLLRKAGFPRWGLCFFLNSHRLPAVRDFDTLFCQTQKLVTTPSRRGSDTAFCDMSSSLGLFFADLKNKCLCLMPAKASQDASCNRHEHEPAAFLLSRQAASFAAGAATPCIHVNVVRRTLVQLVSTLLFTAQQVGLLLCVLCCSKSRRQSCPTDGNTCCQLLLVASSW